MGMMYVLYRYDIFLCQGELRISVLPTHLSYDAPWPIRKVPLRCTPHFCQYHQESKVRIYMGDVTCTELVFNARGKM